MNISSISGNWVDLIIIILLIFYITEGLRRGLVLGILDLLGFIISFIGSLEAYPYLGNLLVTYFSLPASLANAAGFFIAGFILEIAYSLFINTLFSQLRKNLIPRNAGLYHKMYLLNKVFGIIPSILEGFIFFAFILTLIIVLPVSGAVKKDIISSKLGGKLVAQTQGIERELNNVLGQAINDTLTFITVNPHSGSEETIDLQFTVENGKINTEAESRMLKLINSERSKYQLTELAQDLSLRELARNYAKDMFARGYFSHYPPEGTSPFDRMIDARINFLAGGENLALAPSTELAHQGLMNSPGHRANILSNEFGKVGIGVIDGGMYGMMFVQEFTD